MRLEELQEARRQKELADALDGIGDWRVMALCILAYETTGGDPDDPSVGVAEPALGHEQFVAWARAGLPADGLPHWARAQDLRAQDLARRLLAGEDVPELGPFCLWFMRDRPGERGITADIT